MIRRPPRSTLDRSSAASDVYKRQVYYGHIIDIGHFGKIRKYIGCQFAPFKCTIPSKAVSYTHLRAHETVLDLVCRLLLEKKKK